MPADPGTGSPSLKPYPGRSVDPVPIPGTKRVSRVEENTAAADIILTPEHLKTLDRLTLAEGGLLRSATSSGWCPVVFPVITGKTGTDPVFGGAADFDLELLENWTPDGHIQELIYRPTLH